MSSLNKATVIGNLGEAPKVTTTQDGRQIVSFPLATTETWKDKQTGEKRDKTEWHKIVIFNEKVGQIAAQYLKKGSKAYIEGQLQTRKWTDKDGHDRYTTEIVLSQFGGQLLLLSPANDGNPSEPKQQTGYGQNGAQGSPAFGNATTRQPQHENPFPPAPRGNTPHDLDDEVPF